MYLGIDLGTSNSAIVGNDAGNFRHFKTPEGMDVMPSAVMFDRRGGMFVGRKAYDYAAFSPENVKMRFKRLMGTSSVLTFKSADKTLTPEEASAEVLKELLSQAKMATGDARIVGTVITIPAAFNQMQSEATMRAAGLAGLEKVALLQEPIAAAMATIASTSKKSGQYLIYDLGGGTFDAAIVQCISGNATVIAHAGINMLGGSDFDREIVNNIVRPWLLESFDLPDDFQTNAGYERLIRIANYRSELAKIALSTHSAERIFADENQVGLKDQSGQDIFLDVEISRDDLVGLISDQVDKSIALCRSLLADNGFDATDIDKVILIGGPSRMPYIREKVGFELGIDIDLSVDPMTAVAMGAAIYAESRDWSGIEMQTTVKTDIPNIANARFEISFEYVERTANEKARIRIKSTDKDRLEGCSVTFNTDAGWTSGKIKLQTTTDVKGIPLLMGQNLIKVSALDVSGNVIAGTPSEIVITRMQATSDGMPLMHNIGVKVAEGGQGFEVNVLATIAPKGKPTPTRGSHRLRAAKTMRAGDGSSLEVELYEHEDGILEPDLALPIGLFVLKSTDLQNGDILKRGEDVMLHWTIDQSGLMDCKVEFPSISQFYDIGYLSTAGHKNFDGSEGDAHAQAALELAKSDIDKLDQALGVRVGKEVSELRNRLEKRKEQLTLTNDADVRRSVVEDCRAIRQEINNIKSRPDNVRLVLKDDIEEFADRVSSFNSDLIDEATAAKIGRLAAHARTVLDDNSGVALGESIKSLQEARSLAFTSIAKNPGFWVGFFDELAEERSNAVNKIKHDELVAKGQHAINAGDIDTLRSVVFDMKANSIKEPSSGSNVISGLMKG